MFDAEKGNRKVTDEVDKLSDEFAALFEELPPREQRELLKKANEMMSDKDSVSAFSNGTFAQNSSGQPAAQLTSGNSSSPSITDDEALQVIMTSSKLPDGVKALIIRAITPSDPNYLPVEKDGTPKELAATRKERDDAIRERDAATSKLNDEKDENKSNSLAQQLKAAKATSATPEDMVKKTEVVKMLKQLRKTVDDIKPYPLKGGTASKDAALKAVDEEVQKHS
jgi:hypothetical protein